MKLSKYVIPITFILFSILSGCSNGHSPVTPSGLNEKMPDGSHPIVGVSDFLPDGSPADGMGIMGFFELKVDAEKTNAELVSLRKSELTDVLEVVDITNFLQLAPCTNCVKIKSVSLDSDDNLVVSIGIKHPFEPGDPLKPVSGRNRADLHVFNVEGIVVSNADGVSYPALGETVAGFKLVNADGYTGYLDTSLDGIFPTDATIHPYKLHFDDYSSGNFNPSNPTGFENVTTPGPSGNLVMAMGCDYSYQDYVFDMDGRMNFIFAVGCTYAVSAESKSKRFEPEYRIPQHNKKAASEITISVVDNNLKGEDISSTSGMEIRVVDINNGVPVGEALNEMLADSSVNDIFVEIPGVMTNMLVIDGSSPVSGTGHSPSDPLLYSGTITNTAGAVEGTYNGLVKVTDNYVPGQNGSPLLAGMDGIERVEPIQNPLEGLFSISEFATYMTFTITVALGNQNPVVVLVTNPDPPQVIEWHTMDFDATGSYDPDGTIELYEFDFEWDGVESHFTADVSNTTGLATSPLYIDIGAVIAGVRVTDNMGAMDYEQVNIEVLDGCVIHVDGNNSTGIYDGSYEHPFIHVKDAVDAVTEDNCLIYIHPGIITEEQPGTYLAGEITISNLTNLTIQGEGMPIIRMPRNWALEYGKAAIHAYSSNGLTIKGIEITPYYWYQAGFWIENSSGCTIENTTITPYPEYGFGGYLRANNSPNLTFRNNSLDGFDCYTTSGSSIALFGCNDSIITQNTGYDLPTNLGGGGSGTLEAFISTYGSSNVEISKNVLARHHREFDSTSYVQLNGIYVYGGTDNIIRNNLIYDIYFYSTIGGQTNDYAIFLDQTANAQVYNNTIDRFGVNKTGPGVTYGILVSSSSDAQLYNNILSNIMATQSGTCYGVNANISTTQTYSDVWNLVGFTTVRYGDSAIEGVGGINVDPLFSDPLNDDYTLAVGSPCAGTGYNGDDMGCYGGSDPLP